MFLINNCYRLAKWNQIPYANIDFSIQQIRRKCRYKTDYCPNYEGYHRWQGSFRADSQIGKHLNPWNRYLLSNNQIITNPNRLVSMARGDVCTTNFIKSFMLTPSTNKCKLDISVDPFEANAIRSPVSYLGYDPSKYKVKPDNPLSYLDRCICGKLLFQRKPQPKKQQFLKEEWQCRRTEKFKNMKKWMKGLYEFYNKITGHPRFTDNFNDCMYKNGENTENLPYGHKFRLSDFETIKSENLCSNLYPNCALCTELIKKDSIANKNRNGTRSVNVPPCRSSSLFVKVPSLIEPVPKSFPSSHDPSCKEDFYDEKFLKDIQINRKENLKEQVPYREKSFKDVPISREQKLKEETPHRDTPFKHVPTSCEQIVKEETPHRDTSFKDVPTGREQNLKEETPHRDTSFKDVPTSREENLKEETPNPETSFEDVPTSHEQSVKEEKPHRDISIEDVATSLEQNYKEETPHQDKSFTDVTTGREQNLRDETCYPGTFFKQVSTCREHSLKEETSYRRTPCKDISSGHEESLKELKSYCQTFFKDLIYNRETSLKKQVPYCERSPIDAPVSWKRNLKGTISVKEVQSSCEHNLKRTNFGEIYHKNARTCPEMNLKEETPRYRVSATNASTTCPKCSKVNSFPCDRNLRDTSLYSRSSLKNTPFYDKPSLKRSSVCEPTLRCYSLHSDPSLKHVLSTSRHSKVSIEARPRRVSPSNFSRYPRHCTRTSSSSNKLSTEKNVSTIETIKCPCKHIDFATRFVEGKRNHISEIDTSKRRRHEKSMSLFEVYSIYKNKSLAALNPVLRKCSSLTLREAKCIWKDHLDFLAVLERLGNGDQPETSQTKGRRLYIDIYVNNAFLRIHLRNMVKCV
uniref:Uncharacterized protein n=1 Tax=Glossina pallidipes TaxID=7398 RepID=A0A1B0A1Y0_GLOPL